MWTYVETSWSFVIIKPWRVGLSAAAAFLGWRRSPLRIALSPMSEEWLRQLEASRRPGDL